MKGTKKVFEKDRYVWAEKIIFLIKNFFQLHLTLNITLVSGIQHSGQKLM